MKLPSQAVSVRNTLASAAVMLVLAAWMIARAIGRPVSDRVSVPVTFVWANTGTANSVTRSAEAYFIEC